MKKRITINNNTGTPCAIYAGMGVANGKHLLDVGVMLYIDDQHIGVKSLLDGIIGHYPLGSTSSKLLFGTDLIKHLMKFPRYKDVSIKGNKKGK